MTAATYTKVTVPKSSNIETIINAFLVNIANSQGNRIEFSYKKQGTDYFLVTLHTSGVDVPYCFISIGGAIFSAIPYNTDTNKCYKGKHLGYISTNEHSPLE